MVDTTFVAVVAASVPTIVVGLVGFLARSAFESIREDVREIANALRTQNERLGSHGEGISDLKARVVSLESDRDRMKDKQHDLGNELTSLGMRMPRGRRK